MNSNVVNNEDIVVTNKVLSKVARSEISMHILTHIAIGQLVDYGHRVDQHSADSELFAMKLVKLLEEPKTIMKVIRVSIVGGDNKSLEDGKVFGVEDFYVGYYSRE